MNTVYAPHTQWKYARKPVRNTWYARLFPLLAGRPAYHYVLVDPTGDRVFDLTNVGVDSEPVSMGNYQHLEFVAYVDPIVTPYDLLHLPLGVSFLSVLSAAKREGLWWLPVPRNHGVVCYDILTLVMKRYVLDPTRTMEQVETFARNMDHTRT